MNIFITYDYELFLGPETGTVDNCLIRPCARIQEIAKKHNARFVFFVDVLYLLKLKDYSTQSATAKADYEKVSEHIRTIAEEGHDIELHIHPQWFYSAYNKQNNHWEMDFTHYKLDDCPYEDVMVMLKEGVSLLKEITGYNPICYRAGGYSYPIRNDLISLFKQFDVLYDSSVLLHEKSDSVFQFYDYSTVKQSKPFSFSTHNTIKDDYGVFFEFPITTYPFIRLYSSLLEHIDKLVGNRQKGVKVFGDGKGVGFLNPKFNSFKNDSFISRLMRKEYVRASTDGFRSFYLKRLYRVIRLLGKDYMMIIGHPKNQSLYSLNHLDCFLSKIKADDKICTFRDY